jgi:hypothetical protein
VKKTILLTAFAAFAWAQQAHAALVISEVLFNEIGSDTKGEWLEIYNSGSSTIDLSSYKIGDEETQGAASDTEGMFQFPSGASILPGEAQVIAVDADLFATQHAGMLPTYEVSGTNAVVPNLMVYSAWDPDAAPPNTINLANTNDQAVLLDGSDAIIDSVSWGSSTFSFSPALGSAGNGESYERITPATDTNTAADWRLASSPTPGTVPVPEPTAAALSAMALVAALRSRRNQLK